LCGVQTRSSLQGGVGGVNQVGWAGLHWQAGPYWVGGASPAGGALLGGRGFTGGRRVAPSEGWGSGRWWTDLVRAWCRSLHCLWPSMAVVEGPKIKGHAGSPQRSPSFTERGQVSSLEGAGAQWEGAVTWFSLRRRLRARGARGCLARGPLRGSTLWAGDAPSDQQSICPPS
jgi:hypothetical protein